MKFKTAKKAIMNNNINVISIGYANLQYLLTFEDPAAYTCGLNGWNADIYLFNNSTAIVTGYRPFGNITPDYKIVSQYNQKAREIRESVYETIYDYDERKNELKKRINMLLDEFINYVINGGTADTTPPLL